MIKHFANEIFKVIQSPLRSSILLQGSKAEQSDSLSQESGWLGSCYVNHKICDHSVMSQDHEILPGTAAHLCQERRLECIMRTHGQTVRVLGMGQTKQTDAAWGQIHKTICRTAISI